MLGGRTWAGMFVGAEQSGGQAVDRNQAFIALHDLEDRRRIGQRASRLPPLET